MRVSAHYALVKIAMLQILVQARTAEHGDDQQRAALSDKLMHTPGGSNAGFI